MVLALSLLPALWVRSYRRRRTDAARRASNCCRSCGYDLRASKERCPECGTPMPIEAGPNRVRQLLILAIMLLACQSGCASSGHHNRPVASGPVLSLQQCARLADAEMERELDQFNKQDDPIVARYGPFLLSDYRKTVEPHEHDGRSIFFFFYELNRPAGFIDAPQHLSIWVYRDTGQAVGGYNE
jgi:hypothetical protein